MTWSCGVTAQGDCTLKKRPSSANSMKSHSSTLAMRRCSLLLATCEGPCAELTTNAPSDAEAAPADPSAVPLLVLGAVRCMLSSPSAMVPEEASGASFGVDAAASVLSCDAMEGLDALGSAVTALITPCGGSACGWTADTTETGPAQGIKQAHVSQQLVIATLLVGHPRSTFHCSIKELDSAQYL